MPQARRGGVVVAASKARHFASMFIVASRFVIALVRKLGMILFANNSWGRCYHSQRKVSCVFTQIILRLYDASEYRRVMFMYTAGDWRHGRLYVHARLRWWITSPFIATSVDKNPCYSGTDYSGTDYSGTTQQSPPLKLQL